MGKKHVILSIALNVLLLLLCVDSFAGQVTLTWSAPVSNADGTPISYFNGDYRIYYGTASGNYTEEKNITNADSIVTYPVLDLADGQTYFFAVTAVNTLGNESGYSNEASKEASPSPLPSLTLITPNGGESVGAGSLYPVTWTASGAVSFKVKYSTDSGLNWITLDKVDNITAYNWHVPSVKKNKKNCFIKIIGYDSLGKRVITQKSSAPFAIETVRLLTPNNGETLGTDSGYDISWDTRTTTPISKVKIFLNVDGSGITWKLIAEVDSNPGLYTWMPDVPKTKNKCLIKIVAYDADGKPVGQDSSDNYFVINKN
jgi:hypothetical protein